MCRCGRDGDFLGGSSWLSRRKKKKSWRRRWWLCRAGWEWRRLLDEGQLLVVAHVHVVVHGVRARVGRRHGHGGAVILRFQPQGAPPVTPPAVDTELEARR